ncbi:MAG: SPFH domain-containing protein [Gammaproteobacteria bacterium]|nr:SPFH domain-containing protein [Gammaproteobacteria bacterium]
MILNYFKGEPSQHVIRYRNGEVVAHGAGRAFWYLRHNTSIACVPLGSQEAPFVFKETTRNFQEIAIQGQLTYRLTKPLEVAALLDFTVDTKTGRYLSDDPEKLMQRVVNAIQALTRTGVNQMSLEDALIRVKDLGGQVLLDIHDDVALQTMGVLVESLHVTSVTATPEMHKALEADYRESLQRRADQAIYARRAAAVVEEVKLKHSAMDADIVLEEKRKTLVETQAQNQLTLAESEARAEEMKLNPYGNLPPQALIGLALKEWAANAGKIGNLNITPDLLGQLVTYVGSVRK